MAYKLKWRKCHATDNQGKKCVEYRTVPEQFLIWDERCGAGGWELLRLERTPVARYRYQSTSASLKEAKIAAEQLIGQPPRKEQPRW